MFNEIEYLKRGLLDASFPLVWYKTSIRKGTGEQQIARSKAVWLILTRCDLSQDHWSFEIRVTNEIFTKELVVGDAFVDSQDFLGVYSFPFKKEGPLVEIKKFAEDWFIENYLTSLIPKNPNSVAV